MTLRGYGYIVDPYDRQDRPLSGLGLSAASSTSDIDLRSFTDAVIDQGRTNSCVGQAVADAFDTARRILAKDSAHPTSTSAMAVYAWARMRHQRPSVPLKDFGTYIRSAMAGLREHGAPPARAWMFDPGGTEYHAGERINRINARPPVSVVREGFDNRRPKAYRRLMGYGQNLLDEYDAALSAGMPVVFGTQVGETLVNAKGPTEIDRPLTFEVLGGHAMEVLGRIYSRGGRYYWIKQTYGVGYREKGFALLHESWITHGYDHWCFEL